MFSWKFFLSASVLLLAVYWYRSKESTNDNYVPRDRQVLDAWETLIKEPIKKFAKVSIGINACVDLIVNGTALLQALGVDPGLKHDHDVVSSLSDLQEAFHYHFSRGGAAERFFSDPDVFQMVTTAAAQLPQAQWYVGGNAALMAQTMAHTFQYSQVDLSGPVGPRLRLLLHPRLSVPPSSLSEADAIHLIMEFSLSDHWGEISPPVATRFITSHDHANSELEALDGFFESISSHQPDLVVLSGLHMLEGQSEGLWRGKLAATHRGLEGIASHVPVHLELASMVNPELTKTLVTQVLPMVTSLGLNEQELTFLSTVMGGPHDDIFQGQGQPQIDRVTDILVWLLNTYGSKNSLEGSSVEERSEGSAPSRLSRIHFHCLTFHIVAVLPGTWGNIESSVAAGTSVAGHQACQREELETHLVQIKMPLSYRLHSGGDLEHFEPTDPVTSFQHEGVDLAFSPVLVCKVPLKTVGLGDAISATGLMYSTYNGVS